SFCRSSHTSAERGWIVTAVKIAIRSFLSIGVWPSAHPERSLDRVCWRGTENPAKPQAGYGRPSGRRLTVRNLQSCRGVPATSVEAPDGPTRSLRPSYVVVFGRGESLAHLGRVAVLLRGAGDVVGHKLRNFP